MLSPGMYLHRNAKVLERIDRLGGNIKVKEAAISVRLKTRR